jgi:hypothetical protein
MFIFIVKVHSRQPDDCVIVTHAGYELYNTCHSEKENK